MKRNQEVAVCHDGKWSRRVKGTVIATRNGHHIKVRFSHPEIDTTVEFWARKVKKVCYCKVSGRFINFRHPAYFAGWADADYFCPYFSVYKWKE